MKISRKSLIGLILLINFSIGFQAFGEDPFGPKNSAGNGWSESDWFGWVYDPLEPLYMHAQHGWIYAHEWGDWVWIWDYAVGEWFATAKGTYPMVYELVEDSWLWYYEGTEEPRWYVKMEGESIYSEYRGALLPMEMIELMDMAMGASEDEAEGDIMMEALGIVLMALIMDPVEMPYPVITRSPLVIDLSAPPPRIEASLDFGTGSPPEEEWPEAMEKTGSVSILVTDLAMSETGIHADFVLTGEDLTRGGLPFLDGELTGGVDIGTGETMTLSAMVNFDGLNSMGMAASGQLEVDGTIGDTETFANSLITVTVTNLSVDGGLPNNGTLVMESDENSVMSLDVNMETILGPMDVLLQVVPTLSGGMVISTVGEASILGYTLEVNDVTTDPDTCELMPVSGSIILGMDGYSYTVTFTGDCEEGFRISKK